MSKGLRLGSLLAAGFALLFSAGCTASHFKQASPALNGNWAFTAQNAQGAQTLTLNAGLTSTADGTVSAVGHLTGASCLRATDAIALKGSVDAKSRLHLSAEPIAGVTVSIDGQVGEDGKSITGTRLAFSGGNCSALGAMVATSTQYSQINGTYTGTFIDTGSNQLPVTAVLTQTTQPDANGQFHLSGSATFPNNPCFNQPLITDSLVTGSSLSTTYVEGNSTITAVGTFNSNATQLTISNWTVKGGLCDGDSGTGLLTESTL